MDPLLEGGAAIQQRDYTLIIDKSKDMYLSDSAIDKSPWELMQESVIKLASECEKLDLDGLTVYLFSDYFKRYDQVTSTDLAHIFLENQPSGKTNLADALKDAIDNYFERRALNTAKPNGETILVVTVGEIEDPERVKDIIIFAANNLQQDEELGISLIQVGNKPEVTKFFQLLDNELQTIGARFDICNTVTIDDLKKMNLTDVLINAIFS
ncbi:MULTISPECIES: VWA domain-containing protein [Okeania]|uniref:VWA domain-containing protein n=2 Tax=Microcoleaceae TaxID=1892252 RepID=A0A3N6PDH7_9CYAN|nr:MULTISPECIES: VWA domain-containing protein [Okeania]NEP06793.1 VWA domain-containing protein [Okeania sp. SIO4D6]NEP39081.1 VWA domain-containing protein [Okeania sp. SIO2H7]NEP70442.1 VWA domain-containing protein [Okeania sp. SIO2G5]NEP92644.1 VWA domain-containing protein [Okeania sp. SIO2F5]NEQ90399.1 VWA domain-containing protein [Okeania sp. SIO2G4]NES78257.1 VWA domain-containing protein [Okeania sp. SIO1H4]NES93434.1 VWA domain-containing protein [Okeania sp. SIO2B9]